MTNLKGLENFRKKLDRISNNAQDLHNIISNHLGKIGLEESKKQYTGFKKIEVSLEPQKNGIAVVAQDNKPKPTIAYHEYGTGFYAQGKYKGELPSMTLSFKVNDKTISTNGWQYYYPNSDTKTEYKGQKGWFFGVGEHKVFSIGNNPQHQMYNTAKKIKEELSTLDLEVVLNDNL